MKTYELQACPACGSEHAREFALGAERRLRRCGDCDLVFAPEFADPSEIYVDGYLRGESDLGFGLDLMHPLFQEFLAYAADRRLTLIESVRRPPGRLLDVGCGSGELLTVARDRGWDVQGAEPVEDSANIARTQHGLDVRTALLQDSGLPQRSYDVVTAFHVLEHMTDGRGFLELISQWARPGGYVGIEVPNWASVHRRAHGVDWPGLRPLEHAAHYTPRTLAATMRRAGLEPVKVHTPGFLWRNQHLRQMTEDLGISRLDPWIRRARLTRPLDVNGQSRVTTNELGWRLLNGLQRSYALTRTGMVVLAIARVP